MAEATQKTANYTAEMVSSMIEMYSELGNDGLDQIADTLGKSVRSVRSKLVREGVYVASEKKSAAKQDGPSKKEILREIEDTGFDVSGFEGATKAALTRLMGVVAHQSPTTLECRLFTIDECNYILDRIQSCRIQYEVEGIKKYLPTWDEDPEHRELVLSKTQKPGYEIEPFRQGESWCIIHDSLNTSLDIHADGGLPNSYQTLVPLLGEGTTVIFNKSWPTQANFVASSDDTVKGDRTFNRVYHKFGDEPFDLEQYHKYCSHIDYESLSGLKIETLYHWKIGDIFNFERQKIHCSGKLTKRKIGLTILFDKTEQGNIAHNNSKGEWSAA